MSRELPILFNTEMVRVILDGRKTCTRRVAKNVPDHTHRIEPIYENGRSQFNCFYSAYAPTLDIYADFCMPCFPPYQKGDILYVRETWGTYSKNWLEADYFMYRADYPNGATTYTYSDGIVCDLPKWHPSIHMPKEAARIWLKVTDIRAERLQEITEEQACMEGTNPWDEVCYENNGWHPTFSDPDSGGDPNMVDGFHKLWNSTIKKSDIDRYGWKANPWVWVIEFERCDKEGRVVDGR